MYFYINVFLQKIYVFLHKSIWPLKDIFSILIPFTSILFLKTPKSKLSIIDMFLNFVTKCTLLKKLMNKVLDYRQWKVLYRNKF